MPRTKKTEIVENKKDKTKQKQSGKKTEKKSKISDLEIPVFNLSGQTDKKLSLSKKIFSVKVNEKLLATYVRVYLANQRQGTASTKTQGEVSGSTRKIYRQKGTGRARHGSLKAPIFVGGGVVGGPKPRDFSLKMNKKQKRLALFSALTLKVKEKNILIFSSEILNIQPKTKEALKILEKSNILGEKNLFIFSHFKKKNFLLALRNIPGVNFVEVKTLNPYLVLNYKKIIFFEDALKTLEDHFLKN
ncbi:MAG: 50S ribosomal protein L4 [Microgenomates group bacterium]